MNWASKNILLSILILINIQIAAQLAPNTYWVQFADKNGTPWSIDSPEKFLSEKAIQRRNNQHIPVTEQDLPVNPFYVDSLINLGLEIHGISKWFNGAVVKTTNLELLDTLHYISFISNPVKYKSIKQSPQIPDKFCNNMKTAIDYGFSAEQINMLNGQSLHNNGYQGQGMLIALLDSGFENALELESLKHAWESGRIISFRDFVKDGIDIFYSHYHGTIVFSIMAGIIEGSIYGSAPEAAYVLIRTENASSEYLVEEYNWLFGAEFADSLGADVINSSLGYSLFDNSNQNHSYADMNGNTTPVSRAAGIAASKGMLVVVSAGNEGDESWRYITAPADADSILAVGAVNGLSDIADFSSYGPAADGRVKPDVSAMGVSTKGQTRNGSISLCTGTSCSSPIIAGLAACLWQMLPDASAQDIRTNIIKSANTFYNPDVRYGYGIPDFYQAALSQSLATKDTSDFPKFEIFPNPANGIVKIISEIPNLNKPVTGIVEVYNVAGKLMFSAEKIFNPDPTINYIDTSLLDKGFYYVNICVKSISYQLKIIKL